MSGAKKYDFSAFGETANNNQKQTSSNDQYDFSAFDDNLKKKVDGQPLENGGEPGTSPTQSPSQLPLKREEEQKPPKPAQIIIGETETIKTDDLDPIKLISDRKKKKQEYADAMKSERMQDAQRISKELDDINFKLKATGTDNKTEKEIGSELSDFPWDSEIVKKKIEFNPQDYGLPKGEYSLSKILSTTRDKNYGQYLDYLMQFKVGDLVNRNSGKKGSEDFLYAHKTTGNISNLESLQSVENQLKDNVSKNIGIDNLGIDKEDTKKAKDVISEYVSWNVYNKFSDNDVREFLSSKLNDKNLLPKQKENIQSDIIQYGVNDKGEIDYPKYTSDKSLDDFDLNSIASNLDLKNATIKAAFDRYSSKVGMDDVLGKTKVVDSNGNVTDVYNNGNPWTKQDIENAAISYAASKDPLIAEQINALNGEMPEEMKGKIVKSFLDNPYLKEIASKDVSLNKIYNEQNNGFRFNFPKANENRIATIISQGLEDMGETNWLANPLTQEKVDNVVKRLQMQGKLSETDVQDYNDKIRNDIGILKSVLRGVGGFVLPGVTPEAKIKTTDFGTGLMQGYGETIKGIAKSIEDVSRVTHPVARVIFPDDKQRLYNTLTDKYSYINVDPTSAHAIANASGHLLGFTVPLIAGGIAGEIAGLSPGTANTINMALTFEGNNRDKALEYFPNDVKSQLGYTLISTAGDATLGHLLPSGKIAEDFNNIFKKDTQQLLNLLSSGKITESEFLNQAKNLPSKALQFLGKNAKTAAVMEGFGLYHDIIDKAFGASNKDVSNLELLYDRVKAYKSTLLTTPLLTAFEMGMAGNNKVNHKILWEVANDPEKYTKIINDNALLDPTFASQKEDMLNNLKLASSVVNDLKDVKIDENQKQKYLVLALKKEAFLRKATGISDTNIASKYINKASEYDNQMNNLLDNKDKADELKSYEVEKPQIPQFKEGDKVYRVEYYDTEAKKMSSKLFPDEEAGKKFEESLTDAQRSFGTKSYYDKYDGKEQIVQPDVSGGKIEELIPEQQLKQTQSIIDRVNKKEAINENEIEEARNTLYDTLNDNPGSAKLIEPLIQKLESYENITKTETIQTTERKPIEGTTAAKTRIEIKPALEQSTGSAARITLPDGTTKEGTLELEGGNYVIKVEGEEPILIGEKAMTDRDLKLPESGDPIELDESGNVKSATFETKDGQKVTITDPEKALDLGIQLHLETVGEIPDEAFDRVYEDVIKEDKIEVPVEKPKKAEAEVPEQKEQKISPEEEEIERRREKKLKDNSRHIFTSSELFIDENGDYYKIQNLSNGKKRVSVSDENGRTLTVLDEYDQQVSNDAIIAGGLTKVKDLEFTNKLKDEINAEYDAELKSLREKQQAELPQQKEKKDREDTQSKLKNLSDEKFEETKKKAGYGVRDIVDEESIAKDYHDALKVPEPERTEKQNKIIEAVNEALGTKKRGKVAKGAKGKAAKFVSEHIEGEGEPKKEEEPTKEEPKTPEQIFKELENKGTKASDEKSLNELAEKNKNNNLKTRVIEQARKAIKTLKSIFPNMDIHLHENEQEFNDTMEKLGGKKSSAGNFSQIQNPDGTSTGFRIDINLNKANGRTIAHEITHGVLLKAFGENKPLFKYFRDKISKILSDETNERLSAFSDAEHYASTGDTHEEYIAELTAALADNAAKMNPSTLQKVAALINEVVSKLTGGKFKPFEDVKNTKDIVEFLNNVSEAIREGQDVNNILNDYKGKLYEPQNLNLKGKLDKELPSTGRKPKSKPALKEGVDVEDHPIIDKNSMKGKRYSVTMSDHTKVGEYNNPKTGVKVSNLMGGVFYPYIKGIRKAGIGWASVTVKAAREMIQNAIDQDATLVYRMARATGSRGNHNFKEAAYSELIRPVTEGKVTEAEFLKQLNDKLNDVRGGKQLKSGEYFLNEHGTDTGKKLTIGVFDKNGKRIEGKTKKVPKKEITSLEQLKTALDKESFNKRGSFWSTIMKDSWGKKSTGEWYKFLEEHNVASLEDIANHLAEDEVDNAADHDIVAAIKLAAPEYITDKKGNKIIKIYTTRPELVNEEKGIFFIDAPDHPSYPYVVKGEPVGVFNEFNHISDYFPSINKHPEFEDLKYNPYKAVETKGKDLVKTLVPEEVELGQSERVPKQIKSKSQLEEEDIISASVNVAPLYSTKVSNIEQAKQIHDSDFYQEYKKENERIAGLFNLKVDNQIDGIGGYEFSNGKAVREATTIVNVTGKFSDIVNYAATMGALTPEVQDATIAGMYVEKGSKNHTADKVEVKIDNNDAALKAVTDAGFDRAGFTLVDGEISFFNVLDYPTKNFKEKIITFVNKYNEYGGKIIDKNTHAVRSEYIDNVRRREILGRIAKEGVQYGKDRTGFRDALATAKERNERYTTWKYLDKSESSKEYRNLRQKQFDLAAEGKSLSDRDAFRIQELEKRLSKILSTTFKSESNKYDNAKLEVDAIAQDVAKLIEGGFRSEFPTKRPNRAAIKSVRWYDVQPNLLGDAARTNIIVNTDSDADFLFNEIDKRFTSDLDRKERENTELGYPKRLIEIRTSNGKTAEIQVITPQGYLAKDGISRFPKDAQEKAQQSLQKVRNRLGWNIPDGVGHYFYEINRDLNIPKDLREQAKEISKKYYDAFLNPNSKLSDAEFRKDISDFKQKIDTADKSKWDEGNTGESPESLNEYLDQTQIKSYDKENIPGVSGKVGVGEEPVTTELVKGAGAEKTGAGGVLQAPGAEGKIEGIEQKEVIKQMKPFTDKMVDIEREFKNNGYEIDTDYDNEIQVLDKDGEQVEFDELPNNLKKLAADYEKATMKLGDFDASAREKALAESRKITETEAEVIKPKQAELPQQKGEGVGEIKTKSQMPIDKKVSDMKDILKEYVDERKSLNEIKDILKDEFGDYYKDVEGIIEQAHQEMTTTGIKNVVTERERAERGLAEVEVEAKRSFGKVFEDAKQMIANGVANGLTLAAEIVKNPRPLKAEESAVLLIDRMRISNEYNKKNAELLEAQKNGETDKADIIQSQMEALEQEMDLNDEAARKSGYEQGLGLAARRMLIAQDYSLVTQMNRLKAANGGKEVPKEYQEQLKSLVSQLEEANKKLEAIEKKQSGTQKQSDLSKVKQVSRTPEQTAKEKESIKSKIISKWGKTLSRMKAVVKGKAQIISKAAISPAKQAQLESIVKDVNDMVKLYAESGETNLKKIIDNIHNDLVNDIPDLEKSDVEDIILGKYDTEKVKTPLTKEKIEAQANVRKVKTQIDLLKEELKNKQRGLAEKSMDYLHGWHRFAILSGIPSVAKIGMAATTRGIVTRAENIIGQTLSLIPGIRGIAKKAPREGGISASAEAKAFTTWFDKMTREDVMQTMKTGISQIDYLYGKKEPMAGKVPEWMEFFGRMHSAIKLLPKRAEFFRSLEMRTEHAIKNGKDVNDPMVQQEMATAAYNDALRAIFMQDNPLTDAYSRLIKSLEETNPAFASILKLTFPIVKVPTNYVAEQASYVPPIAAIKAITTLYKGRKGMTPEQADYFMRALKKGAIGTAFIFMGFMNPQAIGGYYTGKRKKDELEAGDIELFGIKLPHFMLHTPLLEMLQIGATMRRAQDAKIAKGEEPSKFDGIPTVFKGVSQQIPFVGTGERISRAMENKGDALNQYGYSLGKSILEPQLMQNIADWTDMKEGEVVKRKTETFGESLKEGVPGLRSGLKEDVSKFSKKEYQQFSGITDKGLNVPELSQRTKYKVRIDDAHPEGVMTEKEYETFSQKVKDYSKEEYATFNDKYSDELSELKRLQSIKDLSASDKADMNKLKDKLQDKIEAIHNKIIKRAKREIEE